MDWQELPKAHGKRGLMLIMGSLLWWGEAAHSKGPVGSPDWWNWKLAVEDFVWVIESIIKTASPHDSATKAIKHKSDLTGRMNQRQTRNWHVCERSVIPLGSLLHCSNYLPASTNMQVVYPLRY